MVSLEIKLDSPDACYFAGDIVSGIVIVTSDNKSSHNGLILDVDGTVALQLSARSVGLFEAFYQNLPIIQILSYKIPITTNKKKSNKNINSNGSIKAKNPSINNSNTNQNKGRIPKGITEYPFEFKLLPLKGRRLYETYHGVYINIQYMITVEMHRKGIMLSSKNIKQQMEFRVKLHSMLVKKSKVYFSISPSNVANIAPENIRNHNIPEFLIDGYFDSGVCNIEQPFMGEITILHCEQEIISIELQFVRVETCVYNNNEIREATEVQNIQIADGNICKSQALPIYMIFPRLFTSITTVTDDFKIEFEINVVVLFKDTHMLTENFPIKLVRNETHLKF